MTKAYKCCVVCIVQCTKIVIMKYKTSQTLLDHSEVFHFQSHDYVSLLHFAFFAHHVVPNNHLNFHTSSLAQDSIFNTQCKTSYLYSWVKIITGLLIIAALWTVPASLMTSSVTLFGF